MNEHETLKAAIDFMNSQGLYREFERYMSIYHNLNDEELQDLMYGFELNDELNG